MKCAEHLKQRAEHCFSKREPLLSLWQEIAEHFYPERADFTSARNIGAEMADNLMTSYPLMARRDLGNSFGAMLRPTAKEWFKMRTDRSEKEDTEAKRWLEWLTSLQKRAMYDRQAQFTRATKEGDHDFSAFGQCVLSAEENRDGDALLYRCWHLRDVAWLEGADGTPSTFYRRWKTDAATIKRYFGKATLHDEIKKACENEPHKEFNLLHCVMPADDYFDIPGEGKKEKRSIQPYISCWIDTDHDSELECVGSWTKVYTVPRWQTVSGSQYAHSPATVAALPDGRLIQAMTRVLLESGEKAVDPPMVAVQEAIRGDVAIFAGGVTWVDAEYDERLGEVLRPLTQEKSALNFGLDLVRDIRMQLADAFYLSKLNLPPVGGPDMTAYEVGQRIQEFIRNTLPLFEPLEMDYNGQLCEQTLEILVRNAPQIMASAPKSIRGAKLDFVFESPLREATEKMKLGQYMESAQVLAQAVGLDPTLRHLVNGRAATRQTLEAIAPAAWINSDAEVDKAVAAERKAAQDAQLLATLQQGADIAATVAKAAPSPGGLV